MGLNEVRKEILDNAKREAAEIIAEAEKDKAEIDRAAEQQIAEIEKKIKQDAEEQIAQYELTSKAEAVSSIKKQKLDLEKELIEEAFKAAKKQQIKGREKILKKLARTPGFSKVYCAAIDKKALSELKPETIDISGGVILENTTGDIRLDLSFDTLLENVKQEELGETAKILFG